MLAAALVRHLGLLCLIGGCATAPAVSGGAPCLRLAVHALRQGDADWATLAPGRSLATGDRFVLQVQVQRPSYVYVLQQRAGSPRRVLWPKAGTPPVLQQADRAAQVPGAEEFFQVDDQPGKEVLYAVVASAPLGPPAITQAIRDAVRRHNRRDVSAAATEDEPEVPDTKKPGTRGEGDVIAAACDGRGVAVAWFDLPHDSGAEKGAGR